MPINESPPLSIKAWPLMSKNMCHFPRFLRLGCISVIWSQRRRLMIHHRVKEIHLNGRWKKKKTEWTKCGGFWYFMACTGLQVYLAHKLKGRIYRWLHSFGNAVYKSYIEYFNSFSLLVCDTFSRNKNDQQHPDRRHPTCLTLWVYLLQVIRIESFFLGTPPQSFLPHRSRENRREGREEEVTGDLVDYQFDAWGEWVRQKEGGLNVLG